MMLKVDRLVKSYGSFPVLNGISFRVNPGECFALLGPNGCGKSTILKSITGAVRPDSGTIQINGISLNQSDLYKESMVYMPQQIQLPSHLPVQSVIDLFRKIRKVDEQRFNQLVQDLEIESFRTKSFIHLSGGMKQKLNILLCFMNDFQIAFLDEPTSSLDPQMSYYLKNLLKKLKSRGKTVVFTSHIMNEVEELADTVALLDRGDLKELIHPAEFIARYRSQNLETALLEYYQNPENHTLEENRV